MTSRTDNTPAAAPWSTTTRWRMRRWCISAAATPTSQLGAAVTTGAVMCSPTRAGPMSPSSAAACITSRSVGPPAPGPSRSPTTEPMPCSRMTWAADCSDWSGPTETTGLFIRLRTCMARPPRQTDQVGRRPRRNADRTVPDGPSADARADQDLDRVPVGVAKGGEGVLDPLQGEAGADQRRRVEDAVGVQPDDPAPGGPGGG